MKKSKQKIMVICILSRPSRLQSIYTKTRPKALEKSQRGGGQFAVSAKNLDFLCLLNKISILRIQHWWLITKCTYVEWLSTPTKFPFPFHLTRQCRQITYFRFKFFIFSLIYFTGFYYYLTPRNFLPKPEFVSFSLLCP